MSNPFLGEIRMAGFNFAPRGWAFCNGQPLPISNYSALYALIGTTYGGDGQTTFGLPDLQGRSPVGQGNGPGLTPTVIGQVYGQESVTLTTGQIPGHSHSVKGQAGPGLATTADPTGGLWASQASTTDQPYSTGAPDTTMSGQGVANAGGGQPHENRPPYLVVNFVIALEGIFPSRN